MGRMGGLVRQRTRVNSKREDSETWSEDSSILSEEAGDKDV